MYQVNQTAINIDAYFEKATRGSPIGDKQSSPRYVNRYILVSHNILTFTPAVRFNPKCNY
jgi:hypothetical protein